jgi:hypothetical protein
LLKKSRPPWQTCAKCLDGFSALAFQLKCKIAPILKAKQSMSVSLHDFACSRMRNFDSNHLSIWNFAKILVVVVLNAIYAHHGDFGRECVFNSPPEEKVKL